MESPMKSILVSLILVGCAHAKPIVHKPTIAATKKPVLPVVKDEVSELEILRYEVAFYKAQAIEVQLSATPEYVAARNAIKAEVDKIDAAHHLDRKAGDSFNPETREITRAAKAAPKK